MNEVNDFLEKKHIPLLWLQLRTDFPGMIEQVEKKFDEWSGDGEPDISEEEDWAMTLCKCAVYEQCTKTRVVHFKTPEILDVVAKGLQKNMTRELLNMFPDEAASVVNKIDGFEGCYSGLAFVGRDAEILLAACERALAKWALKKMFGARLVSTFKEHLKEDNPERLAEFKDYSDEELEDMLLTRICEGPTK